MNPQQSQGAIATLTSFALVDAIGLVELPPGCTDDLPRCDRT